MELRPGAVLLGKYRVESVLGAGGMGTVLRVTHLHLGDQLAIKVLLPEGASSVDVNARFLREAQAVVRLRGEHVARVSDFGVLPEGLPYMVMEYLRGVDLAAELKRRTVLAPGEAVDYILQACEALAEAHASGIIHRDIKPANLFLTTRPDGTPLVKVLDFGISKAPTHPVTAPGVAPSFGPPRGVSAGPVTRTDLVMGTAGYMSPEQMKASKDVDARTDIWALGAVLYECLCGRRAFDGASFWTIAQKVRADPVPAMDPRVPHGLQAVVLRCLEKDRGARFASIAELVVALAPFAADQRAASTIADRAQLLWQRTSGAGLPRLARPATTPAVGVRAATDAGQRRRGRFAFAAMCALLAAIVVLAAATSGSAGSSDELAASPPAAPAAIGSAAPTAAPAAAPAAIGSAAPAAASAAIGSAAAVAGSGSREIAERVAACQALRVERQWRALLACAAGLLPLGLENESHALVDVATAEISNAALDDNARRAIGAGDLRTAAAVLAQMPAGSVYHEPLRAALDEADAANLEAVAQRAQALVSRHDCAGLGRYVEQLSAGPRGTDRAIEAGRGALASCTTKPSPEPASPRAPGGSGGTTGLLVCVTMDVADLVRQARNQYAAGYPGTALSVITQALTCQQTTEMYRDAAMYACGAHSLSNAKLYFAKVPVSLQSGIEQRCLQEGMKLRNSRGTVPAPGGGSATRR
ncbi:MAG TPA: serine/threonine-protein kinase [Kofleriaceae bacterium]|nr:serine/threonine-protein kinase [Kofleriaceae bacterium]